MALDLKIKFQQDVAASYFWVTNVTGAYDASSNTGGFGDPNDELLEGALICLVARVSETYEFLSIVGNSVIDMQSKANDEETTFQFSNIADGRLKIKLMYVPVTDDGITYRNGNAPQEGEYYYHNGKVKKYSSGSGVEVSDLSILMDETNIISGSCETLSFPKLKKKSDEYYRDYKNARDIACETTEEKWRKHIELVEDLQGAWRTWNSGLLIQAHSIIDTLYQNHIV